VAQTPPATSNRGPRGEGRDCFDNRLQEFIGGLRLPDAVLAKIYAGNALELVAQR
jgi:hypothetical protein